MTLGRRVIAGSFWQFGSISIRTLFQLVVMALLARILVPSEFGVIAMANVAIGLVALSTRLGLDTALIQRQQVTEKHIRVSFTFLLLSGTTFFLLCWFLAPLVALLFNNVIILDVFRVLSISLILTNMGIVANSLLQRDLQFKKLFWVATLASICGYAFVGVLMGLLGFGHWALVGAALAGSLIETILLLIMKRHPIKPYFGRLEFQELIRFGGGITLSKLFNYGANNGDYFIIGRFLGATALGVYEQAFKIMLLPAKFLGDILDQVLFAAISTIQEERRRVGNAFLNTISVFSVGVAPTSIMMIMLTPELVELILGPSWGEAVVPAQILLAGIAFRNIARISDGFMTALGAVYNSALAKGLYAAGIILGSLLGTRSGINGVASAVTVIVVLNCLITTGLVIKMTAVPIKEVFMAVLPGLVIGAASLLISYQAATVFRYYGVFMPVIILGTVLITGILLGSLCVLRPQVLGRSSGYLLPLIANWAQRKKPVFR